MAGGIHTRQKCPVCKGTLWHNERKRGCFCPDHGHAATRFVVRFEKLYKNFTSYDEAVRFLNGVRYKKDEGSFDPEDYKREEPNGFKNLVGTYLTRKEGKRSFSHIVVYMKRAVDYFANINVKHISGADIDDFAFSLKGLSDKTRSNYISQLHDFFKWVKQRGVIMDIPVFPKIDFELGRRTITDWETQSMIIEKVHELADQSNEKIGFACELLATYTALRPDDIRRILENSVDENGILIIHNPTKRRNKFKTIRLMPEHIEEFIRFKNEYPAFPTMPFFRHRGDLRKSDANQVFGINLLRKYWTKACKELGIEGVGLYAGTKHTTATETARILGEEKALAASGLTNKAFKRYCEVDGIDNLKTVTAAMTQKKARIVPLKKKKTGDV